MALAQNIFCLHHDFRTCIFARAIHFAVDSVPQPLLECVFALPCGFRVEVIARAE